MRIAIIEDNTTLANGLAHQLRDQGHAVDVLYDGDAGADFLHQEKADIVVLDINLPGRSGLDILTELRKNGDMTPVILLTAQCDTKDRVRGLDAGADDYLVKPFEMEELDARIRALIRRRPREEGQLEKIGALTFDRTGRRLLDNEDDLNLPRRELAAFECFVDRPNQIVPKSVLANHLYGVGADIEEKVIEVYVSRLRKRLSQHGFEIKVARGLGYLMKVSP
jgi:two-component system OmpR family response regulator